MPNTINIGITSAKGVPAITPGHAGDKITWTNNDPAKKITSFTLPTCVSPQQIPAPIGTGVTTSSFTINNGTNGRYKYSFVYQGDDDGDLRGGTIDVS